MPGVGAIVAVGVGAALGAWLRWALAHRWNPSGPMLPLGTLAANLIGGYLIGLVLAATTTRPDISPELRLFIATGFLGGLTTFSTFSAESVSLMLRGEYAWALAHSGAHLLGSLAMTALGVATWRALH
jgi:CrcB protein